MESYAADPREFMDSLLAGGEKADIVVLDPPGTPLRGFFRCGLCLASLVTPTLAANELMNYHLSHVLIAFFNMMGCMNMSSYISGTVHVRYGYGAGYPNA